uniref:Uncharacterized protein n=1 Tax=Ulva partita TaxID=1605170 RepID=A0A1C9ZWC1_9CHLO|nr:hypothetical protein [Ulva partita]
MPYCICTTGTYKPCSLRFGSQGQLAALAKFRLIAAISPGLCECGTEMRPQRLPLRSAAHAVLSVTAWRCRIAVALACGVTRQNSSPPYRVKYTVRVLHKGCCSRGKWSKLSIVPMATSSRLLLSSIRLLGRYFVNRR